MSAGLQFNEEITRKIEALYLTPDVVVQRGSSIRGPRCCNSGRVTYTNPFCSSFRPSRGSGESRNP